MSEDRTSAHMPFLTASALLAGFSFTAVFTIATSDKSGLTPAVMMVASAVATAAFIISAIAASTLIEGLASNVSMESHANFFTNFGAAAFIVGIIAFAVALGASGFLFAGWAGFVTGACAFFVLVSFVWLTMRLNDVD